jgi:hypothetical protein
MKVPAEKMVVEEKYMTMVLSGVCLKDGASRSAASV